VRFVLATANPDKAEEIAAILTDVELVPRPPDVPEVEETGDTLTDNALLKAQALAAATGQAALADDTGLEVDALGGAPGVRSARYAGENATYADNVAKLLHELDGVADRRARFRTVAVASFPGGEAVDADGAVEGVIATEPRGDNGFGYDPVFVPDGGNGRTFAEMTADEKHALSHRGRAFRRLVQRLADEPSPPSSEDPDLPALFYDDGCRFCRASAALVVRTDKSGRLAVLPFSDPAADRRLSSLSPEERAASMHLVRPDGSVLSAGAALTELLRGTPGLGRLARRAPRSPVLQRAIDRVYWAIAGNRSRLGRLVPDVAPVVRRRLRG
jgi:XTP/dITP diphosphohydrolase